MPSLSISDRTAFNTVYAAYDEFLAKGIKGDNAAALTAAFVHYRVGEQVEHLSMQFEKIATHGSDLLTLLNNFNVVLSGGISVDAEVKSDS